MKVDFNVDVNNQESGCAITISQLSWGEFDKLRILIKSIKDYSSVLDGIDVEELSLQKVIDKVSNQNKED